MFLELAYRVARQPRSRRLRRRIRAVPRRSLGRRSIRRRNRRLDFLIDWRRSGESQNSSCCWCWSRASDGSRHQARTRRPHACARARDLGYRELALWTNDVFDELRAGSIGRRASASSAKPRPVRSAMTSWARPGRWICDVVAAVGMSTRSKAGRADASRATMEQPRCDREDVDGLVLKSAKLNVVNHLLAIAFAC